VKKNNILQEILQNSIRNGNSRDRGVPHKSATDGAKQDIGLPGLCQAQYRPGDFRGLQHTGNGGPLSGRLIAVDYQAAVLGLVGIDHRVRVVDTQAITEQFNIVKTAGQE